ncbi:PREDICTED: agglutinin-like protein 1 isoform X3 [Branchiostoma belcheri]|uniref:Agglutinin-like protein 1 isoform X2 n=1 Tax=Branchiostoma belcheri TaxID=7741 RepID=A0A6P4XZ57_BRABE|nr:PREDICTED: agglutinin-like protein 1 isoform X2 [Branchiostoma belcheri]XP_019617429.1 PREDICTED: agglutinin-like protein 1 isoform X3 [Branchiostoma belcheri]
MEYATTTEMMTTPDDNMTTTEMMTTPDDNMTTTEMMTTPDAKMTTTEMMTTPDADMTTTEMMTTPEANMTTTEVMTTTAVAMTTPERTAPPVANTMTTEPMLTNMTTMKMTTTPKVNTTTTEMMTTSTQDVTTPLTTTTEVTTSMMTSTIDLTTPEMTSASNNQTTVQPTTTPMVTTTAAAETTASTSTAQTTEQATQAVTTNTTTDPQTTMAQTTSRLTTEASTTKMLTTIMPTTKAMTTKEPPKPKVFNGEFRITRGVNFTEDLRNKTSTAFKSLENDIKPLLEDVYRTKYRDQFEEVVINEFRNGSVVVDYNVVLTPDATDVTAEDVKNTFKQALNNTTGDSLLGDFVIDPTSVTITEVVAPTPVPQQFELPQWAIIVIIVGVVVLFLLIVIIFALCVRRSRKNSMKGNLYAISEDGRKESLLWMHKKDANGFHGGVVGDGRIDGKTTAQEMREMRSHPSELPLNGSAPINGYGEHNFGYLLNAEDNDTYL